MFPKFIFQPSMFRIIFWHLAILLLLQFAAKQIVAMNHQINVIDQILIDKANSLEKALDELTHGKMIKNDRGKKPIGFFDDAKGSAEILTKKLSNLLIELKEFLKGIEVARKQLKFNENTVKKLLINEKYLEKLEAVLAEVDAIEMQGKSNIGNEVGLKKRILEALDPLAFDPAPVDDGDSAEASSSQYPIPGIKYSNSPNSFISKQNSSPSKLIKELVRMRQKLGEFIGNLKLELLMGAQYKMPIGNDNELINSLVEIFGEMMEHFVKNEVNKMNLKSNFNELKKAYNAGLLGIENALPEEFTTEILTKTDGMKMAKVYEKLKELEEDEAKWEASKIKYGDEGIALLHTLIGNSAIVRNPQSDAGDMENQNELSSKNAHLEKAMENENRRINKKFALLDLRHLHTLVENSATTVGNGRNELSSSLVHLEKAMENENRRIHQKYALLDLRHFYEQRDNFLLRNIFNEIVQLTKGINIEERIEHWHHFDLLNSANNALFDCLSTAIKMTNKLDPKYKISAWTLEELMTQQTKLISVFRKSSNLHEQWSAFEENVMKNAEQLKMAYGWMKNELGWFKELDQNFVEIKEKFAKNVSNKLGRGPIQFANLVLERLIREWMKQGAEFFH